jgi:Glycine zipper 2TM domain
MFKHFQVSGLWLAGLPVLVVAAALAGCGERNASGGAPAADSATQADVSRENELKAREEELARREAEVAAQEHEQQLAREKAEADAAAAEKAAAAKKMAKKPPAANHPPVAASSAAPAKAVPAKPVVQRVTVPGGTALTVALSSDLSSKNARVGDPVLTTLSSNLMINGHVAVPIGTRVTGTITDVISGSKAIGAVPTLGLRFNQLELEDGQIIPITGELVEQGASEKGRDTAKILGGAAAGAVLGHQVKKGSGGKIIGGLLGGAIGAVAAKNTGTEVQLAAGSTLTLTTGEPFTAVVHDQVSR